MKKTKFLIGASLIIIGLMVFTQPIVAQVVLYEVDIDIKPDSCKNPDNMKSKGVLPDEVYGISDFDFYTIDPESITLEGVAPIKCSFEELNGDGIIDLTLKFNTQELISQLGEIHSDDVIELQLYGNDESGHIYIGGSDSITII
jgi:hypothetical protein